MVSGAKRHSHTIAVFTCSTIRHLKRRASPGSCWRAEKALSGAIGPEKAASGSKKPETCRRSLSRLGGARREAPQGVCGVDRGTFCPWIRKRRECEDRDRFLLQAGRDRRLTAKPDKTERAAAEQAAAFPFVAQDVRAASTAVGARLDVP